MTFQVHALSPSLFEPLFSADADELRERKALLTEADSNPGFPCRVSLEDAAVGEQVLLTNFVHQPANSPFQASHAIYVRKDAQQARPEPGQIPEALQKRLLSLRAFNDKAHIIDADVVEGFHVASRIEEMLAENGVVEVHLHNAKLGCYLARVTRVSQRFN